jgi:hypothetical protein
MGKELLSSLWKIFFNSSIKYIFLVGTNKKQRVNIKIILLVLVSLLSSL